MVKIKFIGSDMVSSGIHFTNNGVYEVSDEVAEYLEKTFKNIEILEAKATPSAKPEAKPVKPEVEVGTTVKPEVKK